MTTPPPSPAHGSMPHLVSALGEMLHAINSDYREEMREMREIFEEAKKEAQKPEPDGHKIKALLGDVKEAARTFATLDPAWRGIQSVAHMLGFQ
jgi:hypothetical protein